MNPCQCDNLDGYLAGWLSDDERTGFEAHLAGCRVCRREAEEQRRIDRLLAEDAGRLEPLPPSLMARIEGQFRSIRRHRLIRRALGLSTAAAFMLAVSFWYAQQNVGVPPEPEQLAEKPIESETQEHEAAPPPLLASDDRSSVRVSLTDPSDAILDFVETEAPNVSFVWVYPTLKPARATGEPAAEFP